MCKSEQYVQPNYSNVMKSFKKYQCTMKNDGNGTSPLTFEYRMLLYSKSTIGIFCNNWLISYIHYVQDEITLYTNGGKLNVNWQGHLDIYG